MNKARLLALALLLSPLLPNARAASVARPPVNAVDVAPTVTHESLGRLITPNLPPNGLNAMTPAGFSPMGAVLAGWGYEPAALVDLGLSQRQQIALEAYQEVERQVGQAIEGVKPEVLESLDEAELAQASAFLKRLEALAPTFAPARADDIAAKVGWAARRAGQLREARVASEIGRMSTELQGAGRAKAARLVTGLGELGQQADTPEYLRLAASQALLAQLGRSYGAGEGARIADALTGIALAEKSRAVHETIVRGLGADLRASRSALAVQAPKKALMTIATVAQASEDVQVKRVARDQVRSLLSPAPETRGFWRRLTAPGGNPALKLYASEALSRVAITGQVVEPPPLPVPPVIPAGRPSLLSKVRAWNRPISWSVGRRLAFAGALVYGSTALLGTVPFLAALGALGLAALVLRFGFARNHVFQSLVHAAIIGRVFLLAAALAADTGAIGVFGWSFTLGYAALLAGVSAFAMLKNRPVLGAIALGLLTYFF